MKWLMTLRQVDLCFIKNNLSFLLIVVLMMMHCFTLINNKKNDEHWLQIQTSGQETSTQLQQIEQYLQQITTHLQQKRNLSDAAFKKITEQLTAIQQALLNLPSQGNFQQLQTSLSQMNQRMVKEIHIITQHVNPVKQKSKVKHCFRKFPLPHYLPFKVSGIDLWNGEPQATIEFDGVFELIAKNESRAGWTLTVLSFDPALAVFRNHRGQQIVVNLS